MSTKKVERDKCPWQMIGENTGGDVFWCSRCGNIVNEDGTGLEISEAYGTEEWARWCEDVGYVDKAVALFGA